MLWGFLKITKFNNDDPFISSKQESLFLTGLQNCARII